MRLTPLNLLTSACIVLGLVLLFPGIAGHLFPAGRSQPVTAGTCLTAGAIFFLADIFFRKLVPSLGRLWMMEIAFMVFTVFFVLLIRSLAG